MPKHTQKMSVLTFLYSCLSLFRMFPFIAEEVFRDVLWEFVLFQIWFFHICPCSGLSFLWTVLVQRRSRFDSFQMFIFFWQLSMFTVSFTLFLFCGCRVLIVVRCIPFEVCPFLTVTFQMRNFQMFPFQTYPFHIRPCLHLFLFGCVIFPDVSFDECSFPAGLLLKCSFYELACFKLIRFRYVLFGEVVILYLFFWLVMFRVVRCSGLSVFRFARFRAIDFQ